MNIFSNVLSSNVSHPFVIKLFFYINTFFSVSFIGIFGNILNIAVLLGNRRTVTFTQTFSNLLVALSVFDLVYLVVGVFLFGLTATSLWYQQVVYPVILPIV